MATKVHGSLTALRIAQRQRFAAILHDAKAVHSVIAHDGESDFLGQTSGGVKTKTLRAMGHPFARTSGGVRGIVNKKAWKPNGVNQVRKGVLMPLPINKQTGRLRREIQLHGPYGRHSTYDLFSTAPYAKFVLSPVGTRRMVARGLLGPRGLLRKRHRARLAAYVDMYRAAQKKST